MSDLRATVMTLRGLDLLAECMTGLELHFSRVVLGDGELEDISPAALKERTEMVNEVLELPIIAYKTEGDGTMVMSTQLKNVNLQQGFLNREIGIFAIDPQTETEILYAYRNVGNYGEYIPAGTGSEAWNLIYDAITVIDQAPNVTVEISGGDAYVPTADFQEHISSTNPHPNFLTIGQEVSTAPAVFVDSGTHRKLDYIPIFNLKQQILGNESDIPLLNSRVNQLEREQANIVLQMEAENMMPDCNMLLTEDFQDVNQLDTLTVDVTSCAAGDDSVDVQSNYGIILGSWYWITDGVHCEYVQVKSTIRNSGVYRVILSSPLTETYDIPSTKIYRTTAYIGDGVATGSGNLYYQIYSPGVSWQGTTAGGSADTKNEWETTQGNANNFTMQGNIGFTADGAVTLV